MCGYIMKIVMLQRSRSSLPKVVKKISLRNSKGPQRHLFIPLFCLDYHRGIKRDDYLHSAMVLGIGYLCHWPGGFCLLPLSGTLAAKSPCWTGGTPGAQISVLDVTPRKCAYCLISGSTSSMLNMFQKSPQTFPLLFRWACFREKQIPVASLCVTNGG